jgi:hypothetical protein
VSAGQEQDRSDGGTPPEQRYLSAMSKFLSFSAFVSSLATFLLLTQSPAAALSLFGTREVTAQFATQDGKPMANAEVQVFAPGDPKKPVLTGHTDADGKFAFEADRDGFWSAEAKGADQVARLMIRVGGEAQPQNRFSPFWLIGLLAILLAIAIWYRLLRARSRRHHS